MSRGSSGITDFTRATDARTGLVSAAAVLPPQPPQELLWRSVLRLAVPGGDAPEGELLSTAVAGAYGPSRANAFVRGVGEAVERFALFAAHGPPGDTRQGTWDEVPDALPWERATGLCAPEARTADLAWYPARRLRDGATVRVPAEIIDYPTPSPGARWFEPSPSGAASGAGYDMALRSALCETIERDALLVAWEQRLRVPRVDLQGVCDAAEARGDRRAATLRELLATADRHGLSITAADLPTGIDGIVCTAAVLVHEAAGPPLAAVGCNATDDVVWSVLGAVTESLHMRSALLAARPEGGYAPVESPRTETERLQRLGSPGGIADVTEWLRGFDPARSLHQPRDVPTGDIVRGMADNGGDPLAIELTDRLPGPLREQGWAVVKVVPVGYQALRMDETRAWSWNSPRVSGAAERLGLDAAAGDGRTRPHPLP